MMKAKGIDTTDKSHNSKVIEYVDELVKTNPKANMPFRLALNVLEAGDDFKKNMIKYMRPLIIKGVPSLINDMKSLY